MLDEEFQALAMKTLAGEAEPAEESALRAEMSSNDERREEYAILSETLGALRHSAPALHALTAESMAYCAASPEFTLPSWRAVELTAAVRTHFQHETAPLSESATERMSEAAIYSPFTGSRTVRPNPFAKRRGGKGAEPGLQRNHQPQAPQQHLVSKEEAEIQKAGQSARKGSAGAADSAGLAELFQPKQAKPARNAKPANVLARNYDAANSVELTARETMDGEDSKGEAAKAGVTGAVRGNGNSYASTGGNRAQNRPAFTLWSRIRRPISQTLNAVGFSKTAAALRAQEESENEYSRSPSWLWPWLTVGFACIALAITRVILGFAEPSLGSIEIGLFSEQPVRGSQTNVRAPAVPTVRVRMFQTNNDFEKWLTSRPDSDVKVRVWLDEAENLIRISRPASMLTTASEETRPLPSDPAAREAALRDVVQELSTSQ